MSKDFSKDFWDSLWGFLIVGTFACLCFWAGTEREKVLETECAKVLTSLHEVLEDETIYLSIETEEK